jgi:endonuclease YncB( thermonuclease family)
MVSLLVVTGRAQEDTASPSIKADSLQSVTVWVNTNSGVYHCSGTRWYGTTAAGQFMAEAAAQIAGFRPAYGQPCARATAVARPLVPTATPTAATHPDTAATHLGPIHPVRATASCSVTRIVDGDTIWCSGVGGIRLIGMDSPEADQEPFGADATSALAAFIPPGTEVQLEQDVEARDRYGRLLAYVWHDGRLVNWRMVREGWAVLLTYPPNVQYVDWFTSAERHAREEQRGLWAVSGFDCRPIDHRRRRCD